MTAQAKARLRALPGVAAPAGTIARLGARARAAVFAVLLGRIVPAVPPRRSRVLFLLDITVLHVGRQQEVATVPRVSRARGGPATKVRPSCR